MRYRRDDSSGPESHRAWVESQEGEVVVSEPDDDGNSFITEFSPLARRDMQIADETGRYAREGA
jgi:hypothetical protein